MAKSTMSGPYPLTTSEIITKIPERGPGVFVAGNLEHGIMTQVGRLGRSDTDLAAELSRLVGKWPSFLFRTAPSPAEAFFLECTLFHEIRRLDLPHPIRPPGNDLACAICGAWGAGEMKELDERIKQYRQKAREVRAAAEKMQPSSRLLLIRLAESYERLADAMDTMEAKKDA